MWKLHMLVCWFKWQYPHRFIYLNVCSIVGDSLERIKRGDFILSRAVCYYLPHHFPDSVFLDLLVAISKCKLSAAAWASRVPAALLPAMMVMFSTSFRNYKTKEMFILICFLVMVSLDNNNKVTEKEGFNKNYLLKHLGITALGPSLVTGIVWWRLCHDLDFLEEYCNGSGLENC